MALAVQIQEKSVFETHYIMFAEIGMLLEYNQTCGAYALGLKNILAVTGDRLTWQLS